ncbi:MAG: ABC transporter substrate-binding protein [Thermofilaceae archaeon]|nr:ABC transporter substrate-binding protein [Thermofilaceae archaeon]MDW8004431.1 ABC transporter substrate-binding protein [Thermofilaceae archaeon]
MKTGMVFTIGMLIGLILGISTLYILEKASTPSSLDCLVEAGKFSNPPTEAEKPRVIVGLDAQYPPFTELLPNGSIVGFDVDVMKQIGGICGFEPEFKPWDWATIVEALESGDVDVIASGMTITAERSQRVWFSLPYYTYVHYLVTKAGDDRDVGEILRSNPRIAVQTGSTADKLVEKFLLRGYRIEKLSLESYPAALLAVIEGRAEAGIFDSAFIQPYLKRNPELAAKVRVVGAVGPLQAYGIATRPGDKWLRYCINKALEQLMERPEWLELLKKWNLD